jgi:hypothetical protein
MMADGGVLAALLAALLTCHFESPSLLQTWLDTNTPRIEPRGIEIDTWFVAWRLVLLIPLPFPRQIKTGTYLIYHTSISLTQHVFAIHADIYSQVRI